MEIVCTVWYSSPVRFEFFSYSHGLCCFTTQFELESGYELCKRGGSRNFLRGGGRFLPFNLVFKGGGVFYLQNVLFYMYLFKHSVLTRGGCPNPKSPLWVRHRALYIQMNTSIMNLFDLNSVTSAPMTGSCSGMSLWSSSSVSFLGTKCSLSTTVTGLDMWKLTNSSTSSPICMVCINQI